MTKFRDMEGDLRHDGRVVMEIFIERSLRRGLEITSISDHHPSGAHGILNMVWKFHVEKFLSKTSSSIWTIFHQGTLDDDMDIFNGSRMG